MKEMRLNLVSIALLLNLTAFLGVGTVCAYFVSRDDVENRFTVGNNVTEITENFEMPEKIEPGTEIVKEVAVENTGLNDCYVRVLAAFSDCDAEEYASLDINSRYWSRGDDGYYYYRDILPAGEKTRNLFSRVIISEDAESEEIKGFEIIVYEESINSETGGFPQ